MGRLKSLLARVQTRADERSGEVLSGAIKTLAKEHKRGTTGCLCAYCRALGEYVWHKRQLRAIQKGRERGLWREYTDEQYHNITDQLKRSIQKYKEEKDKWL